MASAPFLTDISFIDKDRGEFLLTHVMLETTPYHVLRQLEDLILEKLQAEGGKFSVTVEDTMDGKLVRWYPTPHGRLGALYQIVR